jgi:hypothetical protein
MSPKRPGAQQSVPVYSMLRAVANTMQRWKRREHDDTYPATHETCGIAKTGEYPLWNPTPTSPRLPN